MKINKIEGKNIRVHDSFKFELDPNLNVFFGSKRIGKTSILYSLEMLFNNSSQLGRLIQHGKDSAEVTALIKPNKGNAKKVVRRIGDKAEITLSSEKTTVPKILEAFEVHEFFNKAFTPAKIFSMSKKDIRKIFMSGIDVPREMLDGPIEEVNSRISYKKDLIKKVQIEVDASADTVKQAERNMATDDDRRKAEEIDREIEALRENEKEINERIRINISNGKELKKELTSLDKRIQELNSARGPLMEQKGAAQANAEHVKRQANVLHKKGHCPTCHSTNIEGLKASKKEEYNSYMETLKSLKAQINKIDGEIVEATRRKDDVDSKFTALKEEYNKENSQIQYILNKINKLSEEKKLYRNEAQNLAESLKKTFIKKEEELKGLQDDLAKLEEEKSSLVETKIKDIEKTLEEKYRTFFFKEVKFYLTKTSKEGNVSDDFRIEYDGTTYPDLSGSESIMAELEFASMISDVIVIDQLERIGNLEDLEILRKFSKETDIQIIGTWVGASEDKEIKLIN